MECPKCHFDNPADSKYCKECGTKVSPAVTETIEAPKEELTRGTTLANRYEIIEELGKGGMGRVYRVEDKKLSQEVALKLIKPEIAKDKKTIERFRGELKTARRIRHKNVCGMYDLGEEKGTNYITMEYVRGEDLKRLIRKMGQLSVGQAIPIAKQICEGLAEAHRLGVVHRDLKPQNVMVDEDGNARIMDFGIARSLEAKGITGAGVMIGTPEYMSPEQVEGKEVDQRSDIYSLGIILYEMVTGRVPFEGDTPFTIGMKHKSEKPQNPKELNTQISDDLNRVILRCLEKDKEKRYQSAGEVRSELQNIEKGIPTTERVVSEKKPLTSREITVTFGLKKLFIPAFVFIALVVVGVIIWQLLPQKTPVSIPSDKPSLAVIYFKNNTGDDNFDIWRSALAEMLIADLSQSRLIRVLSDDRIFGILSQLNLLEAKSYSTEDLKKVATRGGATHILRGTITKSGDLFRINTTLQESETMEILGSGMVEGKGEGSFYAMVDGLTRIIKENLNIPEEQIADDIDRDLGKITTNSPEAFRYYSEGRKYILKGDDRKSIEIMKKAVEIDPEFAMAYRSLAASYGNLGLGKEWRESLDRALELSDRVSIRERYLIQGYAERDIRKRIEAYSKLLELYPDDMIGNNQLGLLYSNLEQWDKASERHKANVQNKDEGIQAYINLADVYMALGMYDEANKILEYYLNDISDNAEIHNFLAMNYLCQGKFDLALNEVDRALSISPYVFDYFITKGDIYLCKGDLNKAEKEYQRLLETKEQTANLNGRMILGAQYLLQGSFEKAKDEMKQGLELANKLNQIGWKWSFHSRIAFLYLKSGEPEKALNEFNKAWENAVQVDTLGFRREILYWKGRTYIEMKSMIEAKKKVVELREFIERGMHKKSIKLYYDLMGMIELEKENFSKAIEHFKSAISLLPYQSYDYTSHAIFYDNLALAYYKSRELEKAQEEYEKITQLTTGRLDYGDIFAKSFYMLGKIYEQQGNIAKAIENYKKFLDLWKDADSGLPEVEDARKSLAGLRD